MGAMPGSSATLIDHSSIYKYRKTGWFLQTEQKKEIQVKVYEQPWVKDTAKADIGAPGGSYSIHNTSYRADRDGMNAVVVSEWRDDSAAWQDV